MKDGPRTRRRALIVLGVLIAAPVLFLAVHTLVARWLLSGPKLRAEINLDPETMFIDWDEAVSLWPGRVRVRNLSIRGSDANVQWIVTVPEARLRYSVLALLTRTFRVRQLRPTSLQFHLRQKVPGAEADSPRLKFLPPIPGFPDPPLREEEVPEPPPPDPWKVDLQEVATDGFDDIWVDGFRYRGRAALRGRFRLTPGHRAQIGPASVEFPGGELKLGEKPVLSETRGRLEATFDPWDVQKVLDDAIWSVVTAKVALEGPTEGVEFLEGALLLGPRVQLSGGPGRFAIAGAIDHGNAAGEVKLTAKGGRYSRPGLTLEGSAQAVVKAERWVLDGGIPEIGGSSLKLTDVFVAGSASKRGWWGNVVVSSGRLGRGLTGKVAVECSDGRPLLAILGQGLPEWTRGLIDLEGLTASADVVLSEPRTSARKLEARGGKFAVGGEYERRGANASGVFLIDTTGLLSVGVKLENGKTTLYPFGARQWFEKERALFVAARR